MQEQTLFAIAAIIMIAIITWIKPRIGILLLIIVLMAAIAKSKGATT